MPMSICRASIAISIAAAYCSCLAGCAESTPVEVQTVVVVTVTGVPVDGPTLKAAASLNGAKAQMAEEFQAGAGGSYQFGLRLPLSARGRYVVDVDALQGDG